MRAEKSEDNDFSNRVSMAYLASSVVASVGGFCRLMCLDKLYSPLSFLTQVYKSVPAIIILRSNLAMDWHPIQGPVGDRGGGGGGARRSNILGCFMLQKPELSAGLMGQFARKWTSFFNERFNCKTELTPIVSIVGCTGDVHLVCP